MRTTSARRGSSSTTSTVMLRGSIRSSSVGRCCLVIVVIHFVSVVGIVSAEDKARHVRIFDARDAEGECRAASYRAPEPDAPAVRRDDGPADVEAQSRALCAPVGRVLQPRKAVEDARLFAQWDALALVAHADDDLVVGHLSAHVNARWPLALATGVLDRVVEQVHQHL